MSENMTAILTTIIQVVIIPAIQIDYDEAKKLPIIRVGK